MELTRKRQGQNIYELFGRACPSCGGLGHVAVLPGKDSLQPLANLGGLVRSAASARAEVLSPSGAEASGGRRRRGGRGGRSGGELVETALPQEFVTVPVLTTTSLEAATAPAPGEPASRRPEPELVAVPMDADQELVYGWLGLNPALLLEPQPSSDNLVVRVVRPGDDAEAVLEEARQQLAAAGPRRRRRGRGGSGEAPGNGRSGHGDGADAEEGGSSASPVAAPVAAPTPLPVTVEITPLEEFTPIPVLSDASIEVRSTRSLDAPAPAPTRGGRSRSRSSAAAPVAVASTTAVLPVIPVIAVQAEPVAEAAAEPDSGEPRRRRRRSSASD